MNPKEVIPDLTGSYDNFQQHWKQRTDTEMHRDTSGHMHDHIHVKFESIVEKPNTYIVTYYRGRNNQERIRAERIAFAKSNTTIEGNVKTIRLSKDGKDWISDDGSFKISENIIYISELGPYANQTSAPYQLRKCRYFSGWVEHPTKEDPEVTHRSGKMIMHDQGGMQEVDIYGQKYTVELTQLVFAHRIKIMKLAIYDIPLDQVGINSISISYTWTNPEAKRLGINLRKIISGWTLIEEGFINSDNLNK